jgi:hypothetical protein
MERIYTATYKDRALLLDYDLPIEQMSKIQIKIDFPLKENEYSFLDTTAKQDFIAPSDWSVKVDEYLYGDSSNE